MPSAEWSLAEVSGCGSAHPGATGTGSAHGEGLSPGGTWQPALHAPRAGDSLSETPGTSGRFGRVTAGDPGDTPGFLRRGKAEGEVGRCLHRGVLQQRVRVAELSFLESAEVSASVTHSPTKLLCPP